jgi:hypothetical protein
MAKNIFINNLDTYVSQAIFQELRNDMPDEEGNKPDDANVIFGTYINKDSSIKPDGVKKMLKVRKAVTNFFRDPNQDWPKFTSRTATSSSTTCTRATRWMCNSL